MVQVKFSELRKEVQMQSPQFNTKGKNRGRLEIMYSIIEAARSDMGRTRIMYKANLSYEQLVYYLGELMDIGLIQAFESEGSTRYRATEKGREFILQFDRLAELVVADSKREVYSRYGNIG